MVNFGSSAKRYYMQLLRERGLQYPRPSNYFQELAKAQYLLESGRFPAITSSPWKIIKVMMEAGKGLSPFVEDTQDLILDSLPWTKRIYWKNLLWSGVFPTGEYNANALLTPKGDGYVILINEGLSDLIHYFTTLLTATMISVDFDESGSPIHGSESEEPKLSLDEAAIRLKRLIHQYAESKNSVAMTDMTAVELGDVSLRNLQSLLSVFAQMFVQAHEIAHAMMGHLDRSGQRILAVRGSDKPIKVQNLSWKEEYEADIGALVLIIDFIKKKTSDKDFQVSITSALAGPVVFFRLAHLIENVSDVREQTHPPTSMRERKILDELRKKNYPESAFQLAEAVKHLSNRLSEHIE